MKNVLWVFCLLTVFYTDVVLVAGEILNSGENYYGDLEDRRRPGGGGGGGGVGGGGGSYRPRPIPIPVYRPRYWNNRPLGPTRDPVVFCYWGSWANLRPDLGAFGVQNMPINLCTHIAYSFIALTAEATLTFPEVYKIDGHSNNIEDFIALRQLNPNLKLVVALGGYNAGSANFSVVSNDDTLRARLVTNLVRYIESNKFDGLDVDWEYPGQRDGAETDKEAFVWLLRDLKAAFTPNNWVLTASVGSTQYHIDLSYDVPAINAHLDYINLMTYDFHGVWSEGTGANAPLFRQTTDDNSGLNVNQSLYSWINSGADRRKLVLGLASYGKTYVLEDRNQNSIGAPILGSGPPGSHTQEPGLMSYYELCIDQRRYPRLWNVTVVDNSYVYANKGDFWVSYDNNDTIFIKGLYARYEDLAGVMFWTMDFDDFSGQCEEEYILIRNSIRGFRNSAMTSRFCTILIFIYAVVNLFL